MVAVGAITRLGGLLTAVTTKPAGTRCALITDDLVAALYLDRAEAALEQAGFTVVPFLIPPGESGKSLAQVEQLYNGFAKAEIGRDSLVIALGGGVVSDLAGFTAATWARGVGFVICATTVESAVDACLGGKTAINLAAGKNLVGAFHHPRLILVDPLCFLSLDARDVRAGLAESVKHALISSAEFFAWHEIQVPDTLRALSHAHAGWAAERPCGLRPAVQGVVPSADQPAPEGSGAIENGDATRALSAWVDLVKRNLEIKARIVSEDERETTGQRMLLNFGHTIGHAIEARAQATLRHGECVALGMTAACRLSVMMGMLSEAASLRVEAHLRVLGLPVRLPSAPGVNEILSTIRLDKKRRGDSVRFVLLEGIGQARVVEQVSEEYVRRAYESLID